MKIQPAIETLEKSIHSSIGINPASCHFLHSIALDVKIPQNEILYKDNTLLIYSLIAILSIFRGLIFFELLPRIQEKIDSDYII